MKKNVFIALFFIIIFIILGVLLWQYNRNKNTTTQLVLQGNIDIRQVSLAFEEPGRIQALAVQEGDQVKQGQVLGRLNTQALAYQAQQAKAQLAVQQQLLQQQKAGARPEELSQARAQLGAAQAELQRARDDYSRMQTLDQNTARKALSRQEFDLIKTKLRTAEATVNERSANLLLIEKGVRQEERAAALAQYTGLKANLELLEYKVAQGELISPVDAVVRARLKEVGDMTTAQTPVYTLVLTSPKWARVYIDGTQLSQVSMGMAAQVYNDTWPDRPIAGKVGYISSVAEFTPKTVQTEELRTHLVYEVRVMLDDPQNILKMGQPVSVKITEPNSIEKANAQP